MRQTRSHSTSTSSSCAKRSLASFASASIAASFSPSRWRWSRRTTHVSTTDVTMPGRVTQLPIVHTAPPPVRAGDLADLERELRGGGEGVAPLVHRRRAGVRGLPAERDLVPLDPEGPEDDPERQAEGLEHRPLLDVELEIGAGGLELLPGVERPVEVDAVRRERVLPADALGVGAFADLVLVGSSSPRRRSSRRASGRSGRPPRPPS